MNVKQELTKGSSSMLVLSVLENEDLYGYMIIKKIAEKRKCISFQGGHLISDFT